MKVGYTSYFNKWCAFSGHYVDVDASHAANATARLRSPLFSNTGSTCATFWYHMYGADVNKLNLYLGSPGKPSSQVWTKSGNQGFMWQYAEVEVGAVSSAQVKSCQGICRSYRQ